MKKLFILLIAVTAALATSAQDKAGKKDTTHHTTLYTCSMHPGVVSDHPGKCPECGMDLILSKKEQMKKEAVKSYACPVHTDVISSKPGKCPQCGKDLTLSKKEQMKTEAVNGYTCPMHPDVSGSKPGKCPKCGMALVEKKKKS